MKIIAKYLVVRYFNIVEVVELENGCFYEIQYSKMGVPNYIEISKDDFYELRDYSKDRL